MENIIITDEQKFKEIKEKFSVDGVDNFHVLADFDRTITKAYVNGKKIPSLISILRDENYLTSDYPAKAHALFNKYHPIEIDPNIDTEEKREAMHEWWSTHFKLLIECELNLKDVEQAVKSENLQFRERIPEFINLLKQKNIPLVILSSSGLGEDSIRLLLEREGLLSDNIYIISNSFVWDESGKAIEVKQPIIHNMNKDQSVAHDFPFFEKIKDRKNVLLLGDSTGDKEMVTGFNFENLLSVGFLNYEVEKNLEKYKSIFDVLVLNDGNFDYVNKILDEISN